MGKTANRKPESQEEQVTSPAALVAFVRLLARQAAQEVLASAQPASASEPDHSEPEDNHEAKV